MLLVVFGPGVSYDSVPHCPSSGMYREEQRPPLADQLFDTREIFAQALATFPRCLPIVPACVLGGPLANP